VATEFKILISIGVVETKNKRYNFVVEDGLIGPIQIFVDHVLALNHFKDLPTRLANRI